MADLIVYACQECGREQSRAMQPRYCEGCGHVGGARDFPTRETAAIARQNDLFRAGLVTGYIPLPGTCCVTRAVRNMGRDFETDAYLMVAAHTDFTDINDPWGDHCFGIVTVRGTRLYWKIDLYDNTRRSFSPAPSDPAQTHRVLTIMLPSEY